jgi:hypothetical protein
MKPHSCFVVSNKPHLFPLIQQSIAPEKVSLFNGEGFESFSRLVNSCTAAAPTEIVIVMSDKVRPTHAQVQKTVDLVEQGYGLVGLYRFGFFGFKKQLMRQIGMFDERYVGGGYEDDDMYIRLKEANIAMYITEEMLYEKSTSSWNYARARPHFVDKWLDTDSPLYGDSSRHASEFVKRKLPEQRLDYDLGPSVAAKFLPWSRTVATPRKSKKYI